MAAVDDEVADAGEACECPLRQGDVAGADLVGVNGVARIVRRQGLSSVGVDLHALKTILTLQLIETEHLWRDVVRGRNRNRDGGHDRNPRRNIAGRGQDLG
ncbi:hypothetical protein D3C80_1593360 [compost metagenome]